MDTNVSLNYWLRRFPAHRLMLWYDADMGKYVAIVFGPGSPSLVGYGYDAAMAVNDLNTQVAAARVGEGGGK